MFKKFLKVNIKKIVLSMVLITIPTLVLYLNPGLLVDGIPLKTTDGSYGVTFATDYMEIYSLYLYLANYLMIFIKYIANNDIQNNQSDKLTLKQKISNITLWVVPVISVVVNVVFYIIYRK